MATHPARSMAVGAAETPRVEVVATRIAASAKSAVAGQPRCLRHRTQTKAVALDAAMLAEPRNDAGAPTEVWSARGSGYRTNYVR